MAGEICRRRLLRAGLLAGLVLLVVGPAGGTTRMVARIKAPRNDDVAVAIATSGDGRRVFVTGDSAGPRRDDFATVAYNAATGKELWVARLKSAASCSAVVSTTATALAVSGDGSRVFVTGSSYTTLAYNATTGARLWVAQLKGGGCGNSLAVSRDLRKVFVTGSSGGDYATVAYDAATGAQLWVTRYGGIVPDPYNSSTAVALSGDGKKVFVTGNSDGGASGYDYATVAYDAATGARLWVARYDGPASHGDWADSLALSRDGRRLIVTGYSEGDYAPIAYWDYATIAYDAATGARRWVARYDGPGEEYDYAQSVAVSGDGARVFVTGTSDFGDGSTVYETIAYNASTGKKLWMRHSGGDGGDGYSLAVSPGGRRVFVTGGLFHYATHVDYGTFAYRAVTGKKLWVANDPGPVRGLEWPFNEDAAYSLAVSRDGRRVFVTGGMASGGTGLDYGTIAYKAASGKKLWVARYNHGPAFCLVPGVVGQKLTKARAWIRSEHCAVGKIRRVYSSRAKKWRVLAQLPASRTELRIKARVRLVVSRGRRHRRHILRPAPGPLGGNNGRITFQSTRCSARRCTTSIYTINPDGTGRRRLHHGWMPAWSPDGRTIVFISRHKILAMTAEGKRAHVIARIRCQHHHPRCRRWWGPTWPTFAPDGVHIAFEAENGTGGRAIWVMRTDGTGKRRLINHAFGPDWSPDGERIAYSDQDAYLYVARADGSHPRVLERRRPRFRASLLTKYPASWSPNGKWLAFDLGWSDVAYAIAVTKVDGRGMHVVRHGSPTGKPAWSPNGMKIAFETGRGRTKLATVNRDGSGFRILARDRHREVTQVSWQRVFSTHHPRRP